MNTSTIIMALRVSGSAAERVCRFPRHAVVERRAFTAAHLTPHYSGRRWSAWRTATPPYSRWASASLRTTTSFATSRCGSEQRPTRSALTTRTTHLMRPWSHIQHTCFYYPYFLNSVSLPLLLALFPLSGAPCPAWRAGVLNVSRKGQRHHEQSGTGGGAVRRHDHCAEKVRLSDAVSQGDTVAPLRRR